MCDWYFPYFWVTLGGVLATICLRKYADYRIFRTPRAGVVDYGLPYFVVVIMVNVILGGLVSGLSFYILYRIVLVDAFSTAEQMACNKLDGPPIGSGLVFVNAIALIALYNVPSASADAADALAPYVSGKDVLMLNSGLRGALDARLLPLCRSLVSVDYLGNGAQSQINAGVPLNMLTPDASGCVPGLEEGRFDVLVLPPNSRRLLPISPSFLAKEPVLHRNLERTLSALLPALRPGARVVMMDSVDQVALMEMDWLELNGHPIKNVTLETDKEYPLRMFKFNLYKFRGYVLHGEYEALSDQHLFHGAAISHTTDSPHQSPTVNTESTENMNSMEVPLQDIATAQGPGLTKTAVAVIVITVLGVLTLLLYLTCGMFYEYVRVNVGGEFYVRSEYVGVITNFAFFAVFQYQYEMLTWEQHRSAWSLLQSLAKTSVVTLGMSVVLDLVYLVPPIAVYCSLVLTGVLDRSTYDTVSSALSVALTVVAALKVYRNYVRSSLKERGVSKERIELVLAD